ncbi:hypothetical protein [Streptomyces canus]|uniref:hypothetical protein n=1 Tax=Streptomyces canus TaxID=58343 RepID=UPI002E253CC2
MNSAVPCGCRMTIRWSSRWRRRSGSRYGKDSDPLIVLTAAAAVKLGLPERLEGHGQPP